VGCRDCCHEPLHALTGLRALVGRSLAEVRLTKGIQNCEQFLVSGFIDDVVAAATLEAPARGVTLSILAVEDGVTIEADRQAVAAVVGNLLQNAFNFTKPHTTVTLRVGISADRVPIQVEDECGGLPGGNGDALFRPFEQRSADRTGARTWSRLQQMGRRSQPWPDPHAQRTWSRMCVHRRLAAVPCSGARVICRLVRSKHSAHLLDADFATRRDAWVARGRVHELRALFRGGWLAALDDFRNWLIREAA
jgi:hypothetical protein